MASAAIINPFQSASTLSSKPGRTRAARRASNVLAHRRKTRLGPGVAQFDGAEPVEDVVAFEIPLRRHVIDFGEEFCILSAERLLDLGETPHIELAFLAFAVGVERRREPATLGTMSLGTVLLDHHLAHEPADRLGDARGVERRLRLAPGLGHHADELRVVVEHLLEMRDEPALVDAVARKPAAEMVVDAALSNMGEGELDRFAREWKTVAKRGTPQEAEELRLREFRRAPDSAMGLIDRLHETAGKIGEPRLLRRRGDGAGAARCQPLLQRVCVLPHLVLLVAIDARDFIQYTDEWRAAEAFLLREIGAAPERLGVRGEEHGERPAALFAERMQRPHVDRVDIGTLLAVDLDVDEEVVHHRGGRVVFEALMGHDVAPMAGSVAHREQDRLSGRARLCERRPAPRAPMHGIVLVLEEIGTGLPAELVTVYALLHGPSFRGALG